MNICFILQHYLPSMRFGGTPVASDMMARIISKDNNVKVISTDVAGRKRYLLSTTKIANYQVIRLRNISNILAFKYKLATPLNFWVLAKHVREADIVHLVEYRSTLHVLACIFKRKNSKFIMQPHGTFDNFGGRTILKNVFDFLFSGYLHNRVDSWIAVTKQEANLLMAKGIDNNKISIIPNGVMPISSWGKDDCINKSEKYILYIGRIHRTKGLQELVLAYKKANLFNLGIKLYIAGEDDGYLAELMKTISKNKLEHVVNIIGPVEGSIKSALLANATLISYVTHKEPYGLVPLEAAMAGTWSLIDKDAGISDLALEYNFADIVTFGDIKQLSEHLVLRTKKKKIVSKSTYRKLLNKLSWDIIAEKHLSLYHADSGNMQL